MVGTVAGVHGHDGTLRIAPESDNPERFRKGSRLIANGVSYTVLRAIRAGPTLLVQLEGVASEREAADLVGAALAVPESAVPSLTEGAYYHFQLIDLAVYSSDGEELGVVKEILQTGANDVYVVVKDDTELLVPAIEDVVLDVDLQGRRMKVDLPEGLESRRITAHKPARPKGRRG